MRTTITLDADVAERLNVEVRRTGRAFKSVVNDALRKGLLETPFTTEVAPFVVRATHLGLKAGLSYDDVEELLDAAEGPFRR